MASHPTRRDAVSLAGQYIIAGPSRQVRQCARSLRAFPPRRYVAGCTADDVTYDFSLELAVLADEDRRRARQAEAEAAAAQAAAAQAAAVQTHRASSPVSQHTSPEVAVGGETAHQGGPMADRAHGDGHAVSPPATHAVNGLPDSGTATASTPSPNSPSSLSPHAVGAATTTAELARGSVDGQAGGESDAPVFAGPVAPWHTVGRSDSSRSHDEISAGVNDLIESLLLTNPGPRAAPAGHSAMAPSISERRAVNTSAGGDHFTRGMDLLMLDDTSDGGKEEGAAGMVVPGDTTGVGRHAQGGGSGGGSGSNNNAQPSTRTTSSLIRNSSTISLSEFDTLHHNSTPFDSATLHTINDKEELRRLLAPLSDVPVDKGPSTHTNGETSKAQHLDNGADEEDDGHANGLVIGGSGSSSGSSHRTHDQPHASPHRNRGPTAVTLTTSGMGGFADAIAVDSTGNGHVDRVYITQPANSGATHHATHTTHTDKGHRRPLSSMAGPYGHDTPAAPMRSIALESPGSGRVLHSEEAHARWVSPSMLAFDAAGGATTTDVHNKRTTPTSPYSSRHDGAAASHAVSSSSHHNHSRVGGPLYGHATSSSTDPYHDHTHTTSPPAPLQPMAAYPYGGPTGWVTDPAPPSHVLMPHQHRDIDDNEDHCASPEAQSPVDSLEASLAQWLSTAPVLVPNVGRHEGGRQGGGAPGKVKPPPPSTTSASVTPRGGTPTVPVTPPLSTPTSASTMGHPHLTPNSNPNMTTVLLSGASLYPDLGPPTPVGGGSAEGTGNTTPRAAPSGRVSPVVAAGANGTQAPDQQRDLPDDSDPLVQMGFAPDMVAYARHKLKGQDDPDDTEDVINFILRLVELSEAGHSMARVEAAEFGPDSDVATTKKYLDKVAHLEQMGFPIQSAVDALATAKGNLEMAAAYLIS
eukprot:m.73419 g.73419  ORF g.73419 m.73419 type:complete len:920 (+) comp8836_c0_seq1:114-2873(+)